MPQRSLHNNPGATGARSVTDSRAAWLVTVADHDGGLEGLAVLKENSDAGALLLWQGLRDIILWGTTPPADRNLLFGPSADAALRELRASAVVDPSLEVPIAHLHDLVARPGTADPELLEVACLAISRWAAATGRAATALHFAEAAALVRPCSTAAAAEAGELALRLNRLQRARIWLRLAASLGRRQSEWNIHAAALLNLGRLHAILDDPPTSLHCFKCAMRVARRHRLNPLCGRAALELFRVYKATKQYALAIRYSWAAQRFLNPGSIAARALRRELAEVWIDTGNARRAIPLLQGNAIARQPMADRIACAIILVRAAAAAQQQVAMENAWSDAVALIDAQGESDATARQLVALAEAAEGHIAAARVTAVARSAAELATRRGDRITAAAAAALAGDSRGGGDIRVSA